MKTRKLLALVLSVLMIISVMPTTIFAAPTAVTAGDTAHEHNHNHFPEEPAVLSSDLDLTTLYIDISALVGEGKTVSGVWLWVSGYIVNEPMIKVGRNIFSYDVTEAVANGATAATYTIYYTDDTASHSNLVDSFVTGKNMWVATGQTKGSWEVLGEATNNITITMTDSYSDSWNGAAIEIYEDNIFVDTITVEADINTKTYTLPYDKISQYTFKWIKGNYDSECSFVISLDEDDLKTVDNAGVFADGETIYTIESKCEHSVSEPCGACSVCSKVCGTDFAHKLNENRKCSICSFECGVTAEHDWTNRDGVCKVCGYECPEHSFDENYACTICAYSYKALVTSEDGTSGNVYEFIDEALEAAESLENCTVKLLDNVSETTACYIDSGKFTIDLNGKTWESSEWGLYVVGTADIKIIDSTGVGGLMKAANSGYPLFILCDTAKLEIAGGSFESINNVVDMSNGGDEVSAELLISGGKLNGHSIVSAKGSKVTITGGKFESTSGFDVCYYTGTLDLSRYADVENFVFSIGISCDVSDLNLILPEGFVIKVFDTNEEVTQLVAGGRYTIAKHVVSVTNADGSVTTNYTSLEDAIEAAELLNNSTVKLLDNISVTTSCYIDSGKFTIDLNGKTWESSQWVLFVRGTADIKITDSTGEGGLMKTTVSTCDLIALYDTAKLEIAGGSFESLNYVVDMSDSGLASSSELIISGGKLSGYAIVNAKGSKVTITDGEFEEFDLYSICYATGTLDLSQYADADKIVLFVDYSADVSTLNLILPEGFVLKNLNNNEEATQLEVGVLYTIAEASGSETAMAASVTTQDGTTTTEYASIGEALTAASSLENSTVKLLDNVTTDYYTIESGKFTIDLNGKIWQSSDVLLYIKGTSQIKICDSSENAGGLMTTSGIALIFLMDETKLEIESGNFSCTGNNIFNMSNYGNETSSELLISDGWFVGNNVASVAGRKATINSGEFDCAWGYAFEYLYGTLDLSNYKGASEMGFYVADFTDALALELILPAGAIIRNYFTGEIVTELASGVEYRIEFSEISSIEIDLGEKADEANVRYAEIGGVVTEIEETDNKHLVEIGEENLLVEVTEKTQSGEFVKSQYFYVDMESQTATKLNMDSYMTADSNTSIRTDNPMGVRFKASVLTSAKNEEIEYVIDEYGFIVATEEALGDEELTLDFSKYVKGVAYNKETATDIVFDSSNDEMHVFTGYVKNIPVANYKTNLVCKTYTKIKVFGKEFVLYGEPVVGNVYDTAKALLEDDTLDTETRNVLVNITLAYENTIGIPGDDLYPES